MKIYTEWTDELRKALRRPFPESAVKWLPGRLAADKKRALAMAYMDARMVMERLDRLVGPTNWTAVYTPISIGGHHGLECALTIFDLTKRDAAEPGSFEPIKAAYSGALKRAAVQFGIGRYLYAVPSVWVDYDARKKQLKQRPDLPSWAIPGQEDTVDPETLPDAEPEEEPRGPLANEAQRYEIRMRVGIMGKPGMEIEDVNKALAKAGFFPLDEIGAVDAEAAIDRLKAKHWINVEKTRRQFWARIKDEVGLSGPKGRAIVHKALGVEHVEDYLDTLDGTVKAVIKWVEADTNPSTEGEGDG